MNRAIATATGVAVFLFFVGSKYSQSEPDVPCATHVESLSYEPIARKTSIAGDAKLRVEVNEAGNVAEERPISGHPLLLKEAEKNIKLWKFKPGHAISFNVTYEFRLVEPRIDKDPPSTISYDLPFTVRVTSNLPPVYP
ncbi:MAG TPA: energy transducer TonB [Terriglobales bacterium]|jgi:hypothetical protein